MKTASEKLDELAEKAARANHRLLTAGDWLRNVNLPDRVASDLTDARQAVTSVLLGLVALGAEDPDRRESREYRATHNMEPLPETPLHLLSSEKAVAYAKAIRAAADACLAMEKERGIRDVVAEMLGDWADIAEMEVFGPVGLGEGRE